MLAQGTLARGGGGPAVPAEAIRPAFIAGHGFDVMAAAGLPKEEIAVIWGFPIHTNSVPVLAPSAGVVPRVPAANQILVGVQGPWIRDNLRLCRRWGARSTSGSWWSWT